MEKLPAEVQRIVCSYLDFQDAANIRYLSHSLSVIAAEFLITRVRFHTSYKSLTRLEKISEHPVFSQTVKELVFEAALLADVKCCHEYAKHFELDHHGLERPRAPPPGSSDREHRLHARNKSKWTRDIYAKYDVYRSLFDSQASLLDSESLEKFLSRCVPRFTKLTYIDVDPVRRCSHMTSARFVEEFGSDCASPLSGNFGRISDSFRSMLLPNNSVIASLRKLEINSLSPSFFKESQGDLFATAFSYLTEIDIILKLAERDLKNGETHKECFHRTFSDTVFKNALSSAKNLENVSIGVESSLLFLVKIADIFPGTIWQHLNTVGLNALTSTQEDFVKFLVRQPNLRTVNIVMMNLTEGSWESTLTEMRERLELKNFMPNGFLEDSHDSWPMDLISVSVYIESYEERELGGAIDAYVSKKSGTDRPPNPLSIDVVSDFEEADVVRDMYGTLSDFDDMSLDGFSDDDMSDGSLSDQDVSDSSMPDLQDVD